MTTQLPFSIIPASTEKIIERQQSLRKRKGSYLFKYLLLTNFCEYLEAGAVPALLLQLTYSFHMTAGEIGLLGGIVYLSLSIGGPLAGYLLRHYDHQIMVGSAITINNIFTLLWALTPVGLKYSTTIFILLRFFMGFTQCIVCMFIPLWTNEFAPRERKTTWMSYQQSSVPFGVMTGYIIASLITTFSNESNTCFGLLCWRWPFIIEVILITPLSIGCFFVPKEYFNVKITNNSNSNINKTKSIKNHYINSQNQLVNLTTPLKSQQYPRYDSENHQKSNEMIELIQNRGLVNNDSSLSPLITASETIKSPVVENKSIAVRNDMLSPSDSYHTATLSNNKVHFIHNNDSPMSFQTAIDLEHEDKENQHYIDIKTITSPIKSSNNQNHSQLIIDEIPSQSDDENDDDTEYSYNNNHPHYDHRHKHNYNHNYNQSSLTEKRSQQRLLRRHSVTASLIDPMYTRNIVRNSYDNLALLGTFIFQLKLNSLFDCLN